MLSQLRKEIKQAANPEKAKFLTRYFKTGKGEYAEGDKLYGINVPTARRIAKRYYGLSLNEARQLLSSPIHEERLIALFVLVHQFQKGDVVTQKAIYDLYLANTTFVNNWDLVDSSADKIVGAYLEKKDRFSLQTLARSTQLWERRIAILSTYYFIKQGEHKDTFVIADILLQDEHDLIHKAVGWMLREVGNYVSQTKEEEFLKRRYKRMPRTMLRYAIEKFSPAKRQAYLKGTI